MMAKAESHRLHFIHAARDYVRTGRDVHGKLYDSREGFAVCYRWKSRDIFQICKDRNITRPKIHVSVFERIGQGVGGYAPGNIPLNCEIVSHHGWPGSNVFEDIQTLLRGGEEASGHISLMSEIAKEIFIGKALYYLFIPVMILSLLGVWFGFPEHGWKKLGIVFVDFVGLGLIFFKLSRWIDKKLDDKYSGFWSKLLFGLSRRGMLRGWL